MNPAPRILLLTLGGSSPPLLTAIATLQPTRVVFAGSGNDPATGKPGTIAIAADTARQAGLAASAWETLEIPADDLDAAHAVLVAAIHRLQQTHAAAELLADYTGGTKSMSAALVLAALGNGVALHLTTGPRTDHQRVTRGQDTLAVKPDRLQLQRHLQQADTLWQRHAYAEAAALLADLPCPDDASLRGQLQRQRGLSAAFAAWDNFDHAGAAARLADFTALLGKPLTPWTGALSIINKPEHRHAEPLRLLDLWRNAQRRAAQGRHDDAVARLYRLLEWTAQWLLASQLAIATADVPIERIPPHMSIAPTRDGKRSIGLFAAWELLAHHRPNAPGGQFFTAQRMVLLNHLNCRNRSILAHGFTPVATADWQAMATWAAAELLPLIIAESGLKAQIPQLPNRLFE